MCSKCLARRRPDAATMNVRVCLGAGVETEGGGRWGIKRGDKRRDGGRRPHPRHCRPPWGCQSSAAPAQFSPPGARLPWPACCWPQPCWSWTAGSAAPWQSAWPEPGPRECHLCPYKAADPEKKAAELAEFYLHFCCGLSANELEIERCHKAL